MTDRPAHAGRKVPAAGPLEVVAAAWVRAVNSIAPGPIILALSGGLDSVVLTRVGAPLLRERAFVPIVATLDHGWRGDVGLDELRFCERIATELGLDFEGGRSLPDPADRRDLGPEAEARTRRLSFLRAVARSRGAVWIALAHHEDDQLESQWMRWSSGREPLGMRPHRAPLLRPLLTLPRSTLRAAALAAGWAWRDDPSNADARYTRTRARAVVQQWGRFEREVMLETGARAAAEAEHRNEVARSSGALGAEDFSPSLTPAELLDRWPHARRPTGRALAAALSAARRGDAPRADLGGGWALAPAPGGRLRIVSSRRIHGPVSSAPAAAEEVLSAEPDPHWVAIDLDRVVEPLRLRPTLDGEHLRPYGHPGQQAVREMLRAAGVPPNHRASWPLLVDARGSPLWLVGIRRCAGAEVHPGSSRVLVVYIARPSALGGLGAEVSVS